MRQRVGISSVLEHIAGFSSQSFAGLSKFTIDTNKQTHNNQPVGTAGEIQCGPLTCLLAGEMKEPGIGPGWFGSQCWHWDGVQERDQRGRKGPTRARTRASWWPSRVRVRRTWWGSKKGVKKPPKKSQKGAIWENGQKRGLPHIVDSRRRKNHRFWNFHKG